MSTADESKQQPEDTNNNKTINGQAAPEQLSEYKRKKNWISGVDNDLIVLGVAGTALAVAGALAFPHVKEWMSNITNKQQQLPPQQPPLPVEEQPYIPPTPPLPPTAAEQQQAQQEQQEQQQQVPQQPPQEEEIPDTFYDDELQKRRQLLTGRKHLKYDSQFGAGIANS